MECVIEVGNKQYKIKKDAIIYIDQTKQHNKEKAIVFDKVLYVVKNDTLILGKPYVKNAKVEGIIEDASVKGTKLQWIKYGKSSFMKKKGYRHKFSKVRIIDIKI